MSGNLTERERLWRERISSQVDSGMTITEFCETVGVSTAAFYQWRKRLGLKRNVLRSRDHGLTHPNMESGTALFVPVAVRESADESIRLELAREVIVQIPEVVSQARLVTIFRAAMLAVETTPC